MKAQRRRNLPATERATEGWLVIRPIINWSAEQVVNYVTRIKKIKLNPLYKQGMHRVGCMPCINCAKDELSEIAKRFPAHIDKIREWELHYRVCHQAGIRDLFQWRCKTIS